jgi:hypothetical protein
MATGPRMATQAGGSKGANSNKGANGSKGTDGNENANGKMGANDNKDADENKSANGNKDADGNYGADGKMGAHGITNMRVSHQDSGISRVTRNATLLGKYGKRSHRRHSGRVGHGVGVAERCVRQTVAERVDDGCWLSVPVCLFCF